jgi:predicted pyridoxine 5'-phosphate oxidase superfamily flavin-nucleotide-binding protein
MLNDAAQQLVRNNPGTLITLNRDGSAQVSLVWLEIATTTNGDHELVTGHLDAYLKVRNIRREPRVALSFVSTDRSKPFTPYLIVKGVARIEEGGAPELIAEVNSGFLGPGPAFPPPGPPPGYRTCVTIEKVGGIGPWEV